MLSVVDLFAGTGGLSEGFASARIDGKLLYELRLLVDNDPDAALTFRSNRPSTPYLVADLETTTAISICKKAGVKRGNLDVLMGGPPCQGFTVLRRKAVLADPRNGLLRVFIQFANAIRPRSFLIENVPNLLTAAEGRFLKEIRALTAKSYKVTARTLNAYDFGVPQWRRRTFIVGLRNDLPRTELSLPLIPENRRASARSLTPRPGDVELLPLIRPWVTTEEAIGDLPSLEPGEEANSYDAEPFSDYQAARRKNCQFLSNHMARQHDSHFLQKLAKIKEGSSNQELDGRRRFDRGREVKYLSQAYGRLHREGIAQTITAHFLNPGSGRFIHYRDLRSITVREAARFQSFDDNFIFHGPLQKQQKLVGNAVPPLMARALAEHVGTHLSGTATSDLG